MEVEIGQERGAGLVAFYKEGGAFDTVAFDFTGQPIMFTLDGSKSHDADGEIVTYRWLSGTLPPVGDGGTMPPDGGAMSASGGAGMTHRLVPPGEPANWPDDVKQPMVELGEGFWAFTLWVIDDRGANLLVLTPV